MRVADEQLPTLGAAIDADPALSALPNGPDANQAIADAFNAPAVPAFWVYRTSATEADYIASPGPEGTNWTWQAYMTRSQGERDGWGRMFSLGSVDPSRANIRAGMDEVFNGTGAAATQRAHIAAVHRRAASRAEKLFATGAGSAGSPATMDHEGAIHYEDVTRARNT